MEKDILGWNFQGGDKTMMSEENKLKILTTLKEWCLSNKGIQFLDFHKTVSKVHHTSKGIPVVRTLSTLINHVIALDP